MRSESCLFEHQLTNGLQVIGQQIPGVESASAMFWVKTGARNEDPGLEGVSHFLEHMAFKRTRTRTYEDVNREFEEMGAENNAFTWLEMTAYHARVLGDRLPDAIELLADLTHPVIDQADFDQERKVILEEIARHRDQPYSLVIDEFLQTCFPGRPLGHSTLGSSESIGAMKVDDMKAYWRRRYGADNMIFSVAGNFDWDRVVEQVQGVTADWHQLDGDGWEPAGLPSTGRHILAEDRWNQEHIVLGVPSIQQGDRHEYAAAILSTILGDDTGSRLFWSINQTGLADQIGSGLLSFSDAGLLFVIAVTTPDKARRTLGVIRDELRALEQGDIASDELERARTKLLTSNVIEAESTQARMMGIVDSWLSKGRLETLDEVRAGLEAVTVRDLQDYLERFPLTADGVLTAVGPLDSL